MSYNKETGMYEGFIYKIYNDVNDKIYIGQTRRFIAERFSKHISDAFNRDDNMALHAAIRKYGRENFHICEIECIKCDSKDELVRRLNEREVYNIVLYNSKSPNGYNVSTGGVLNDTKRIPIVRYDTIRGAYYEYDSIVDAEIDTGISSTRICACCNERVFSCDRNIFRYKSQGITEEDIIKYTHLHPKVKKYNFNGDLINTYITQKEAAEDLKAIYPLASITSITACCKGKLQTAYGFIWRYEFDDFDKYAIDNLLGESGIRAKKAV